MKIAVAGTGYVGLVTGVALAHIGHNVTCLDNDTKKIKKLKLGICPVYESELEDLMNKNKGKLNFTTDCKEAYDNVDAIFVCVGTPEKEDGSANLDYIYKVCESITKFLKRDCNIIIKSTVPIGTNDKVEEYLRKNITENINVNVSSNPEFLSQGTAVHDTLYASRIVVGTENEEAEKIMREIYKPFTEEPYNIPYLSMNRRSAEMVKYASNDFLALKISYINEIANFCEKIGADIIDVTNGMKFDSRIGSKFLSAGIGYGGSCFPKDTKSLHYISNINGEEITTVRSGIEVNKRQKKRLFEKLKRDFKNLKGISVAVLGCAFKPGTDDIRESPSIDNVNLLLEFGCQVFIYDPLDLARNNFKKIYGDSIKYFGSIDECIKNKDVVMIMTEHKEIVDYDLNNYVKLMKKPVIYDGRNCYLIDNVNKYSINYISIGRQDIANLNKR